MPRHPLASEVVTREELDLDNTPQTTTFNWTNGAQSFVVPAGVVSIDVVAKGAKGGGTNGGNGARVLGTIVTTPGETLGIYVGGQNGYNGGGAGGNGGGSSGGGASDIRRGGSALTDRVIVAGGGGGAAGNGGYAGGAGGLPNGSNGAFTGIAGGGGATTTAGGSGSQSGTLGVGGSSGGTLYVGGGGGGLYGGGSGNGGGANTGGGGGSSLIPAGGSAPAADNTGDGQIVLTYTPADRITGVEAAVTAMPRLLAAVQNTTGGNKSTTSTTQADVDATNSLIAFTAPPSGKVLVKVRCTGNIQAGNVNAFLGIRESTTDVISKTFAMQGISAEGHDELINWTGYVSGLTPGSAHTYKLAFAVNGGVSFTVRQATSDPVILEVWSVPA